MREYSSATNIRSKCKVAANSAKRSEESAYALDVSTQGRYDNAASKVIESQNSVSISERWAIDKSKDYFVQVQKYNEDIVDIVETARSYTLGDTGLRPGEESDNAKYYYSMACDIEKEHLDKVQTVVDDVIKFFGLEDEIDAS